MLDRLTADWPLKAVALVVAFALWVTITGEDRVVKDLAIPLEIQLRDEHIMAGSPPTEVTVRVEGPRTVIRNLDPIELAVRLDLQSAAPGARVVQFSDSALFGLPKRVNVTFFEPDRVTLVLDRRMRRELPVVADLTGSPPEGYTVYRTRVRPAVLTVEGPESVVRSLDQLRTDPLQLDHRTRAFTAQLGAVPDRPEVRIVDPRPLEVRVVIDTVPVTRTFEDVVVQPHDPSSPTTIDPPTTRVTLKGPEDLLDLLTSAQIRAVADVSGLEPGGPAQTLEVTTSVFDLPEEQLWRLEVESVRPRTVSTRLAPLPES